MKTKYFADKAQFIVIVLLRRMGLMSP